MNNEPKNIWKKSFTGRTALVVWLAVAVFTVLLGSFIVAMLDYNRPISDWMLGLGILTGGVLAACLILIYVVWPLLRWLSWKHWRRSLFGLACLATLIALFYAEEDWRGKYDWEKFKHEWAAKGVKLDYASIIPPAVPDDQNFALTPVVASCYESILSKTGHKLAKWDTNIINRLSFDLGNEDMKTTGMGYWARGTTSDLKPWQEHYRELAAKTNLFPVSPQPQSPAADVLLALSKYDSTVEELRRASHLSQCRFPLNYDMENPWNTMLPQLAAMKSSSQLLRLRAIAELQNGQSDKALADVQLALRMIEAIRQEPFLISQLVRFAMTDILLQPIYEGLANHQWTDAQLVALETALAKLDFLADYQFSLRGERAMTSAAIDYISKKQSYQRYQEMTGHMYDNDEGVTTSGQLKVSAQAVGIYLMPAGWFDQNKLFIAQRMQDWITGVVSPQEQLVSPKKYHEVDQAQSGIFNRPSRPWNFLAKYFPPALGASVRKASREQISVDLARTAIALERYRLVHGEYPESLDVLAPQFIAQVPHDVIGGGPLHYRREADGQFVLYSVGWNEQDDGGVVVFKKGSSPDVDINLGDWVWRYPVK